MTHPVNIAMRVATALRGIRGLDAVVLGGSYATGSWTTHSDIDIGIYYGATMPINLEDLNRVASQLDDEHRPNLVTALGDWGPWVNAGAWMQVDGHHVDLILRDTMRVIDVVTSCESGKVQAHYQPGHPHAYINVMYMGELAISRMIWDATGVITPLKQRAEHYPDAVQRAILEMFGFEARFSAELAMKSINRNDMYYVMAHVVRSISAMNQVIFAVNRQYCLNEKKAVARANSFDIRPVAYQQRVDTVLRNMAHASSDACDELLQLVDDTVHLTSSDK